jgi:1-aminocyclopropane-1-carboxylate deaminase/D-cysteine desulfhydrase-like pyridoxal-dependent ACC family enzyme
MLTQMRVDVMSLSRRRFLQGMALAGAGVAAGYFSQSRQSLPVWPAAGDVAALAPPPHTLASQSLALGKFFPALTDPDAAGAPWIVNTLTGRHALAAGMMRGEPGNAVFVEPASGRAMIPWTPLFAHGCNILPLPHSVTRRLGGADVVVLNESDPNHPIYGNKARKYEFLLPNLQWSGVRRTATLGAVSSNHALQFALANRIADLTGKGEPLNSELDLVLFEVPGTTIDDKRLAMLQALSRRVVLANNMVGLAGEVAFELAVQRLGDGAEVFVPPGGSNELSVLGHMNAVADFAHHVLEAQLWRAPPDVIFVAMGSGSTVLGILLGVHLMGWDTQVVGVADQDKPYLSRLFANQQPSRPFVEGNVAKLAHGAVDWLNRVGFPGGAPTVEQLLRRKAFIADSASWEPGYGLVRDSDVAWQDELETVGLKLDPVFTLKAWRSLVAMAQAGALKGKRVLFWNTYNAFDYVDNALPLLSGLEAGHATL